jgi:pyruvate dehydrogenase E2 component (dihydrolipoamide acetyltransferase)
VKYTGPVQYFAGSGDGVMTERRGLDEFEPSYTELATPSIRRVIAQRMLDSKLTIPHFYLFDEVDMESASELRDELNSSGGEKISFNDIIVKAAAMGLEQHQECNVSYVDGRIRRYDEININIAVAIEGGLLVPTLRNCRGKSLQQISAEIKILAEKARNKKLRPREGMGGTFTISNLGVFGLEGSFSIINPPQALILTTGAIRQVPVVKDGELGVGLRMKVTLSCDHRAVDGAVGAQFLVDVKKILEQPDYIAGRRV